MILALLAAVALSAQSPQAPADTALLRLGNRVIFTFRAPIGASRPAERAEASSRRLAAALEAGADSVDLVPAPQGMLVTLGGTPVFTVTPGDADTTLGVPVEQAAAAAALRLRTAVAEQQEARTAKALLIAAAQVLFATLIFSLLVRLLLRLNAGAHGKAEKIGLSTREFKVRGFTLLRADQIRMGTRLTITLATWAIGLFVGYLFVTFLLTRFAWTRPWGEALGDYLVATIGGLLVGLLHGIPDLFTVILIFIGVRLASRVIHALFEAVSHGSVSIPGIHPETAEPSRKVSIALLWVFALIVAYPYLPGSGTDAFKGVSVFAGLLLSLGSSGVVGQAMSGLVLMYSRALKVGDFVQIGDIEGTVTDLGLLSTKLRTNKLAVITIPSVLVLGNNVKNYSRLKGGQGVILHSKVTIGYDAPWRQVHALLVQAAERTEGIRKVPSPFVRQVALSDFYPEYEINVFVDEPREKPSVLSMLHANIQDLFNEHGVQIMSPNYRADKDKPVLVPKEQWFAPPAAPPAGKVDSPPGEV